jgi:hypothetical protein
MGARQRRHTRRAREATSSNTSPGESSRLHEKIQVSALPRLRNINNQPSPNNRATTCDMPSTRRFVAPPGGRVVRNTESFLLNNIRSHTTEHAGPYGRRPTANVGHTTRNPQDHADSSNTNRTSTGGNTGDHAPTPPHSPTTHLGDLHTPIYNSESMGGLGVDHPQKLESRPDLTAPDEPLQKRYIFPESHDKIHNMGLNPVRTDRTSRASPRAADEIRGLRRIPPPDTGTLSPQFPSGSGHYIGLARLLNGASATPNTPCIEQRQHQRPTIHQRTPFSTRTQSPARDDSRPLAELADGLFNVNVTLLGSSSEGVQPKLFVNGSKLKIPRRVV